MSAMQAKAASTVQALRYGATLYHFFQQNYFDALTELMVAQELDQLGVHSEGAQLLRGGISLSFGMDRAAQQIFEQHLAQAGTEVDRDKAWFYLGKIAWQRRDNERARQALGRLSAAYEGSLLPESQYFLASMDLVQGRHQLAAATVERLPVGSPWRPYLYYNLGVAQANQQNWPAAVAYFRALGELPATTEETRALRDRAYSASGYAAMAADEFDWAQQDFRRVRLSSPVNDQALLGYGWALGESGDYLAALAPWRSLAQGSAVTESVRDVLLAIPYAYQQLGKPGIALEQYRHAAAVYAEELNRVRAAEAAYLQGDISALLGLTTDNSENWLSAQSFLPQHNYAPLMRHLLSRENVQLALRELSDLQALSDHLARADHRLDVLREVDSDQQQAWSEVLTGNARDQLRTQKQALANRIARLRARYDRALASEDTRVLADSSQLGRWQSLDRVLELASLLDLTEAQTQRVDTIHGMMIWMDSEQYPARRWQVGQQLAQLEVLANHSGVAMKGVDRAVSSRRFSSFKPRIEVLKQRLDANVLRVEVAVRASKDALRQLAVSELQLQASALSQSLAQSRLAMARLYDQGSALEAQ